MLNLGAAMAGGNGKRAADDFYPTPPEATVALMQRFGNAVPQTIWEPAVGDGAISRVLHEQYRRTVWGSDIVDRGAGATYVLDFLIAPRFVHPASAIITNPPFNKAAEFIEKALSFPEINFVAMLLKSTFWHAARRASLFRRHPPSFVLPLLWRLDFDGRGAPTMDCAWNVWLRGHQAPTQYELLPKPNKEGGDRHGEERQGRPQVLGGFDDSDGGVFA